MANQTRGDLWERGQGLKGIAQASALANGLVDLITTRRVSEG